MAVYWLLQRDTRDLKRLWKATQAHEIDDGVNVNARSSVNIAPLAEEGMRRIRWSLDSML